MDEGFTPIFLIWPKMKCQIKVPILFLVIIEYYNLVNSGKEQSQTTHGDRYDENRPIVLLLVKVYFITVGLCNR
jgi:hypothetical protein